MLVVVGKEEMGRGGGGGAGRVGWGWRECERVHVYLCV